MGFRKITPWKKQRKSEPVLIDVEEPSTKIVANNVGSETAIMLESVAKLGKQSPTETPEPELSVIPRSNTTAPIESNTTQPEYPQIEVYQLDDLANGIKRPVFTETRKEYHRYKNTRS